MMLVKVLCTTLLLIYVSATENVIFNRHIRQIQQYNEPQTDDMKQSPRRLQSELNELVRSRPVVQNASPVRTTPILVENNQDRQPSGTTLRALYASTSNINRDQEIIIGDTTTMRPAILEKIEVPNKGYIDLKPEPKFSNTWSTDLLSESTKRNSENIFTNNVLPESVTTSRLILGEETSTHYSHIPLEVNPVQTSIAPKLYQESNNAGVSVLRNAFVPTEMGTILVNPDEIQDVTETLFDYDKLKQYKQGSLDQNDSTLAMPENLYVRPPPQSTIPSIYKAYYGNNQAYQVGSERLTNVPARVQPPYNIPLEHKPLIKSTLQPQRIKSFTTLPSYIPKSQLLRQSNSEIPINPISPQPNDQECLTEYGYYGIENDCDSFIECKEKHAFKNTCPEGLHFNPKAVWPEYPCSYPSEVQCDVNARKEPPIPTAECPHQFGFFQSPDGDCNKYIMCQYGKAINMSCAAGLVFNSETATCDWPDNVPTCEPNIVSVFSGFICPQLPAGENKTYGETVTKHRYGNSCRKFVACQKGIPRLLSCDLGLAFDEKSEKCVIADYVANCENDKIN